MKDDGQIVAITPADIDDVCKLAGENGGSANMNPGFIRHWYFDNPSRSYSFMLYRNQQGLQGIASTNNFVYNVGGKPLLVAMPQNVLTSVQVRGQGVFGRLYQATEKDNIAQGVGLFFTVTNAMSTDIFLNKFGYVRARCPDLVIASLNPLHWIGKKQAVRLPGIQDVPDGSYYQHEAALLRDAAWVRWRYARYTAAQLHVLRMPQGYAVLVQRKMKGIPVLFLADMLVSHPDQVDAATDAVLQYASRSLFPAVLFFRLQTHCHLPALSRVVPGRFNFLVKGINSEETAHWKTQAFNVFFGDLDIV